MSLTPEEREKTTQIYTLAKQWLQNFKDYELATEPEQVAVFSSIKENYLMAKTVLEKYPATTAKAMPTRAGAKPTAQTAAPPIGYLHAHQLLFEYKHSLSPEKQLELEDKWNVFLVEFELDQITWASKEGDVLFYKYFPELKGKPEQNAPTDTIEPNSLEIIEPKNQLVKVEKGLAIEENATGKKFINYFEGLSSSEERPGGECVKVCRKRMDDLWLLAKKGTVLDNLPESTIKKVTSNQIFETIWYSNCAWFWQQIPELYRGKGAAGAMAWSGKADLLDEDDIWVALALKPGAVIQTWSFITIYEKIKNGEDLEAGEIGHSFFFLSYVFDEKDEVIGMKIADQGTIWSGKNMAGINSFGYWAGANLK